MWVSLSGDVYNQSWVGRCTVDDREMVHVNQVGHLSKTPLNLLEIYEIGSVVNTSELQQNYNQI